MAWKFRRRVKIIPGVHLNFSKSGISTSIGTKGASLTIGSSGAYLNTSIPGLGLYNRQKISGKSTITRTGSSRTTLPDEGKYDSHSTFFDNVFSADIHEITSQDMQGVKEAILLAREQRKSLKDDLSKIKRNLAATKLKKTLSYVLLYGLIKKAIPASLSRDIEAQEDAIACTNELLSTSFVKIEADFDPEIRQSYETLLSAFHNLSSSRKIWDVTHSQFEDRYVSRSAASTAVSRRTVRFAQQSLPEFQSDLPGLYLQNANGGDLYIYPSFIIMYTDQTDLAVIGLQEIDFQYSDIRFVEHEHVPSDSIIVDHTWAKVNRNGTPDRRFKDNYQIPIVRYGEIRLKTKTGLHEQYTFSNREATEAFAQAFLAYQDVLSDFTVANKTHL